jgi:hypothetical protein
MFHHQWSNQHNRAKCVTTYTDRTEHVTTQFNVPLREIPPTERERTQTSNECDWLDQHAK